jgi:hypothetical protein
MRWVGHVAHMGRGEVYIGFWWERNHLEDVRVDGRIIQWKLLIMITLGLTLFDNNNRLITLSGGYKNLHYLTQFIVTTIYMYKKQQNLF